MQLKMNLVINFVNVVGHYKKERLVMKKNISVYLENIGCIDTSLFENHISIEATVKDNKSYLLYLINRHKYEPNIRYIIEGEIRGLIMQSTWKEVFNEDSKFINKIYENINNELKHLNLKLTHLKITKYV